MNVNSVLTSNVVIFQPHDVDVLLYRTVIT